MPTTHFINDTTIKKNSIAICGSSAWQSATRSWESVTCTHCLKHRIDQDCSYLIHEVRKAEGDTFCKTCGNKL